MSAIIAQEGADHLKPVIEAIYKQESGAGSNARTSIDGAHAVAVGAVVLPGAALPAVNVALAGEIAGGDLGGVVAELAGQILDDAHADTHVVVGVVDALTGFGIPLECGRDDLHAATRLYPGSNILAATPEDFSKDNRERLFAKIITGDWDAVVIGHSSLKKIGLPEKTEIAVLQEQIDELADAIEDMKRARGDKRITADMERIRKNLDAKMKDKLAAVGKRSKMVTFDELGIDAMFIDEMHEFKNLTYNTTMDRNPGMGNPAGSAKAFDLFVKVRWLFDTFGDKTPFITATGTPVSNSLVEMFNMQRYMQ